MGLLLLVCGCLLATVGAEYTDQNCADGRQVIVHLFSWKWTDIERECREFLGPRGFCGIQISPPNEHRMVEGRPWWERYQPVSYILGSRSGTPAEFSSMVRTCNENNVRIYVDVVINHMTGNDAGTGFGSAGSFYDAPQLSFPGVPYDPNDFSCCSCPSCNTPTCNIQDYDNPEQVRNCRLFGLLDLDLQKQYVQGKIAEYMNQVIAMGVAGFRVDAAKYMWPRDLDALYRNLNDLNTEHFPAGSRPYLFQEVIDDNEGAIRGLEYVEYGTVTDFKYCDKVAAAFRGFFPLSFLQTLGESWGLLPSDKVHISVDNHDNQRGHGSAGDIILTFYDGKRYILASIFTMAWNYGHVGIMSSYSWPGGPDDNDSFGPPHEWDQDYTQKDVDINPDGSCGDGSDYTYVCEHRWNSIANMAEWRNEAGGEGGDISHWWDNGKDQIAFSRNGRAFVAINNEPFFNMEQTLQTGLPEGIYCDVISGRKSEITCTGREITVDSEGLATIAIETGAAVPAVAIHRGSRR